MPVELFVNEIKPPSVPLPSPVMVMIGPVDVAVGEPRVPSFRKITVPPPVPLPLAPMSSGLLLPLKATVLAELASWTPSRRMALSLGELLLLRGAFGLKRIELLLQRFDDG